MEYGQGSSHLARGVADGLFALFGGKRAYQQGEMIGQDHAMNRYLHEQQAKKAEIEAALGQSKLEARTPDNMLSQAARMANIPLPHAVALNEYQTKGNWGFENGSDPDVPESIARPAPDYANKLADLNRYLGALSGQLALTGNTNYEQLMDGVNKNHETKQKLSFLEDVIRDPTMASKVSAGYGAVGGKPVYDNVMDTGFSINRYNGQINQTNDKLAALNDLLGRSRAYANNQNANKYDSQAGFYDAKTNYTKKETEQGYKFGRPDNIEDSIRKEVDIQFKAATKNMYGNYDAPKLYQEIKQKVINERMYNPLSQLPVGVSMSAPNSAPRAAPNSATKSFANEKEAMAAVAAGKIKAGDSIIIGGKRAIWSN